MPQPDEPISNIAQPASKPSQLEEAALTHQMTTNASAIGQGDKERTPVSTDIKADDVFEGFSSRTHDYLWASLTFAEQKAAFVFTVDTAFLGYLLSIGILEPIYSKPSHWNWLDCFAVSSVLMLLSSVAAAVSVVMPRLAGSPTGLIYFGAIAPRSSEAYVSEVVRSSSADLARATLEHCHELARITRGKYIGVRLSMWLGILGFAAGLVFATFANRHAGFV